MVLFSLTSAILEVSSAVAYFIVDKSVRGISRIIYPPSQKRIDYNEPFLIISEENTEIDNEIRLLKKELIEIKELLKNK